MCLEVYINLIWDCYKQKKLLHAVVEIHVFDRIICFPPTVVESVNGLYPRCSGQMHSTQ
jgi:hypothetical protein